MLVKLHIRNFALINAIDLNFNKGFTVFTGETGSGKSIILGALNLILGDRADTGVIRNTDEKAIVEAIFDIQNLNLESFFEQNDLDYAAETVIRREVGLSGKSRAFINDTPVQLSVLNALTSQLIKIHSQYHTYALKSQKFQLNILDSLVGLNDEVAVYQKTFSSWKKLRQQVSVLEQQLLTAKKEADYVQFQLDELETIDLFSNDFEALEVQLNQQENATEILTQISQASQFIESENGLLDGLNSFRSILNKNARLHPVFDSSEKRIQSVIIEIKDIQEEISQIADEVSFDEEKLAILNEKMDSYNRLLTKHQVRNQEELKTVYESFKEQSSNTAELESKLEQAKSDLAKIELLIAKQAEQLHTARLKGKQNIEKLLEEQLERLKLVGAQVIFDLEKQEQYTEFGVTNLSLLFTSNKGSNPKPIEKAASGGELSRLMLSIERLMSEKQKLPTLMLDEIDTGVSGDVANKMGAMLGEMGKNMQMFTITHLPQVAAKGMMHYKVFKQEEDGVTQTFVKELNEEERVHEIASLMSGEQITDAALETAKNLMIG